MPNQSLYSYGLTEIRHRGTGYGNEMSEKTIVSVNLIRSCKITLQSCPDPRTPKSDPKNGISAFI